MSKTLTTPPWDDETEGSKGPGTDSGEGASITAGSTPASASYLDKSTALHEMIMVQYSLISFTRLLFGLSDFAEDVINSLNVTIDDIGYLRENLERR